MLLPIAHARQLEFIVFDLETTGIDYKSQGITQISAVRVRRGEIINEAGVLEFLRGAPFGAAIDRDDFFTTLVRPHCPIPDEVVKLTGITNDMVRDAPVEADVLPAFARFAQGGVLVAHNGVRFDVPFLQEAYKRCGLQAPADTCLDTLRVCRRIDLASRDVKYSLSDSLARHNIPCEPDLTLHNALVDSLLTARMLIKFLGILEERERDGIYIL